MAQVNLLVLYLHLEGEKPVKDDVTAQFYVKKLNSVDSTCTKVYLFV